MLCRLAVRGRRLAVGLTRHRVPDHQNANGRDLLGEYKNGLGGCVDGFGLRVGAGAVVHRLELIQQLECRCQMRARRLGLR